MPGKRPTAQTVRQTVNLLRVTRLLHQIRCALSKPPYWIALTRPGPALTITVTLPTRRVTRHDTTLSCRTSRAGRIRDAWWGSGNSSRVAPLQSYFLEVLLICLRYRLSKGSILITPTFRYNITTDDYDPFNTDSNSNQNIQEGIVSPIEQVIMTSSLQYSAAKLLSHDDVAPSQSYWLPTTDPQNPLVDVGASGRPLRLALNTNQYGRTFQDRTHAYRVSWREAWGRGDVGGVGGVCGMLEGRG